MTIDEQQQLMYQAGEAALVYIPTDAEVVVFGAGRTVCQALEAAFNRGLHERMSFVCGSQGTETYARELGINVGSLDDLREVKYTYIDGTDQVDPDGNLIKGGLKITPKGFVCMGNPGNEGCMKREKELAYKAGKFIVIADGSKVVEYLGENNYPLPAEFLPHMENEVAGHLERKLGAVPILRQVTSDGKTFVTENNNYIFDVPFAPFDGRDLYDLEIKLKNHKFGVVATGLFAIKRPNVVIIARPEGIEERMIKRD